MGIFLSYDHSNNSLIEGAEACRQCEQSKLLPTLFTRRYYAVRRTEDRKIECHKIGYTFYPKEMQKNLKERFNWRNYTVDGARTVQCSQEGWDELCCTSGIMAKECWRKSTLLQIMFPWWSTASVREAPCLRGTPS